MKIYLIYVCFLFAFVSCSISPQCDTSVIEEPKDIAIRIKEIEYDKTNQSISLNLLFLGKYNTEFSLFDIYSNLSVYKSKLEYPKEELCIDSLFLINMSKFIIQSCNGKWRFIRDAYQNPKNKNDAIITISDCPLLLPPHTNPTVYLKLNKIDSMKFGFDYRDLSFENKRLPDKFRIILLAEDSVSKPILLYSNWINVEDIKQKTSANKE